MTYLFICVPFLVVALIAAIVAPRRMPRAERPRRIAAVAIAAAVLLVLTAVFDSLMIAAGLFGYADGTRLGPTIGLAPIEDFAYPLAAVLLVPAVWTLAVSRERRSARAPRAASGRKAAS
ncbi:lycopene cyclase domain-containing protein [Agromyces sp. NPDC058110]|uniref:lycopene cyclase domain-containing protein n=1 Tax=Agromyces sp. NPDC058110 TaxID=3346345 RepID=UPI0036DAD6B4